MKYQAALFIALLILLASASRSLAENFGFVPGSSISLGQGFDPTNPTKQFKRCISSRQECALEPYNSTKCLFVDEPADLAVQTGMANNFKVKQINSKYDFFRELNISASISGSYGPFSGSASYSYMSVDDISIEDLTWIISQSTDFGSFGLRQPTFVSEVARLSTWEKMNICGPQVVVGVRRGVTAVALFRVHNLSEFHKKKVEASLKASFSAGYTVSGGLNYREAVQEAVKYGEMDINVFAIGGEGAAGLADLIRTRPSDLDNVRQVLSAYVKNQKVERSTVTGFSTQSLGAILNDPTIESDYGVFLDFLDGAMVLLDEIKRSYQNVSEIIGKQQDYPGSIVTKARSAASSLNCAREAVMNKIQACRIFTESKHFLMADRNGGNDAEIGTLLKYGFSNGVNASGLQQGLSPYRLSGAEAPLQTLSQTLEVATVNSADDFCRIREAQVQRTSELATFRSDLVGAIQARRNIDLDKLLASDKDCDLSAEMDAVVPLRFRRTLPFTVEYFYDLYGENPFGENLAAVNVRGLYVDISSPNACLLIKQISFFRTDTQETIAINALADPVSGEFCRRQSNHESVRFFVPITVEELKTTGSAEVRIEVVMRESQNQYAVALPAVRPAWVNP